MSERERDREGGREGEWRAHVRTLVSFRHRGGAPAEPVGPKARATGRDERWSRAGVDRSRGRQRAVTGPDAGGRGVKRTAGTAGAVNGGPHLARPAARCATPRRRRCRWATCRGLPRRAPAPNPPLRSRRRALRRTRRRAGPEAPREGRTDFPTERRRGRGATRTKQAVSHRDSARRPPPQPDSTSRPQTARFNTKQAASLSSAPRVADLQRRPSRPPLPQTRPPSSGASPCPCFTSSANSPSYTLRSAYR